MKNRWMIQTENALFFGLTLFLYIQFDFSLLLFFLLLLVVDITMLGYLVNPKVGALIYNMGHSFILPTIILATFFFIQSNVLLIIAFIWYAHIFMDRALGYGLKYSHSFKETHLQKI